MGSLKRASLMGKVSFTMTMVINMKEILKMVKGKEKEFIIKLVIDMKENIKII